MRILIVLLLISIAQLNSQELFKNYPAHLDREIAYRYPTERYIDAYGWEQISSGLKSLGLSMVHRNLFDRVWHREEVGFLGYHGSTQEYRIYQDIIRYVLEEHVDLSIRDDFHFFRVPGESTYSAKTLEEYGDYQRNYSPTHFLCMNYALYGNFNNPASCSYYYFAENSSLNCMRYETLLIGFFKDLGLDPTKIEEAFEIGRSHLGSEKGVLMQVFDMSHFNPWKPFYELSDHQCGSFTNALISEVVAGTSATRFHWQIRMLMSNAYTLNPHSSLVIKRYDSLDPNLVERYEHDLRAFISQLSSDHSKNQAYKSELIQLWGDEK